MTEINRNTSSIISIGDELISGQVENTNSVFLANFLEKNGIENQKIITIPDRQEELINALDSSQTTDHVFVTGGLGPTHDDRTKKIITEYFDTKLVKVKELSDNLEEYFSERNIKMSDNNYEQAMVPQDSEIIPNEIGTATGFHFTKNDTEFYFLPGVPAEMKRMVNKYVLEELPYRKTYIRKIHTFGIPESKLAQGLKDWISQNSNKVDISFLPQLPGVDIIIKAKNQKSLDKTIQFIQKNYSDSIYGFGQETPAQKLGEIFTSQELTIGVAESCTGGLIGDKLTNVSGSSQYFTGGIVAYSNAVKRNLLNVDPDVIDTKGAVSASTAREMCQGIKATLGTEIGLSTTGIAGPTGGSPQKPVGTMFIGISTPKKTFSQKYIYNKDRLSNKSAFAKSALINLLKTLQQQ